MATTLASQVQELYIGYLGRAADKAGLDFWVKAIENGTSTLESVALGFTLSAEYKAAYEGLTTTQLVAKVYQNVLGRVADADGLGFWVGEINKGVVKADTLVKSMINSLGAIDQLNMDNKVQAANTYTTTAGDKYDLAAAKAAIGASSSSNPGQTFTLTEAVQDLVGTAGNDLFVAGVTGANNTTLTAGDKINGGAGNDTLELYGTNNAAAFSGAAITSVEVVKAQVAAAGATALNVSTNADVKEAWLSAGSSGANTVTLTKAQAAGLQGAVGTTVAPGVVTFAFSDATTAAGDAATLVLDGANTATGGSVTINDVESLTVKATGTNSLGTLTDAVLETLTVTGAGALSATLSSAVLKTINASAATGKQNINAVASAAVVQTITTGSADDELTTTFAGLTKDDKIDLGAGNDVLAFTDAVDLSTAAAVAAKLVGVSNVEGLKVNGAVTFAADASLLSQNSFIINTTGAATLTNLANTDKVTLSANTAGTTLGLELGQNTLNLTMEGTTTGTTVTTSATGTSIVNLVSNGTVAHATNVLNLTTADNNAYTVTGSKDLTLVVSGTANTVGQKVDASAFTGKLTVTGTAAADIIIGGSGDDVITGGAKADTLTGGAGKDKFVIEAAKSGAAFVAADADIITDFVSKTDTITVAGTTAAWTVTKATAAVTDFAAALAAANAALGTSGTATAAFANAQQVGADTYVFISNDAAAGAEHVVKLVGVALSGVDAADFVIA